jgi:hypothetical protein
MSLEMAHKVILPPQKNYIPQFLKQRDINSYYIVCTLSTAKQNSHKRCLWWKEEANAFVIFS